MENLELIRILRFDGVLDAVWLPITNLGSELGYVVLLSILFLRFPKIGRQLGIWFGISVTINTALKLLLDLPRPYDLETSLTSEAAKETAGSPGLPSGHAQNATFFWGFLALDSKLLWFRILAIILIILISFSRLSLGVHFLEDVLVGLLIGAGLALLASQFSIPEINWQYSLGLILLGGIAAALLPEPYSRSIAVGIGFAVARANFAPPQAIAAQIGFVFGGIVLALVLYFASSLGLPETMKRSGLGSYIRYLGIVAAVAIAYPRLLRQWLPQQTQSPS